MITLGQKIRQKREELKMSQEVLADLIGTSQNQVSRYERDENKPTSSVLSNIADALQTTPDWLLGRMEGDLTPEEAILLDAYRSKEPYLKSRLLEIARIL